MPGWASRKKRLLESNFKGIKRMNTLSNIDFGIASSFQPPAELKHFSEAKHAKLADWIIPNRKTEAWKYSSGRLGLKTDSQAEHRPATVASADYASSYALDCHTIVINNGEISAELPVIEHLTISRFNRLNTEQCKLIAEGVTARSAHLLFADLNAAFMQNGVLIEVAANQTLDKPLKVVFQQQGTQNSFPRVFIHVGKNASMTLIEESVTQSGLSLSELAAAANCALLNTVCDIHLSANSKLTYLKMNLDQDACRHIAHTGVAVMRDARFESFCLALGNQLNRHDLLVKLLEPGAECNLNGMCVTKDKEHVDSHTCIEHIAPHCTSNENYRCIADGKSQIVFNGRIHIHPDAQKTLGSMSNKNLLLSSEAEIDAKPELEIYADDVKCAHGTTIGQLDKTELYYLQTRGISLEQAKLMLTLGFVLELVRACPVTEVADFWEQTLTRILGYKA
jgi:Fe-S cluster assembly protein SufD